MGDVKDCIWEHNTGTCVNIHVHPSAKKTDIVGYDMWRDAIVVKIKADAKGGKANRELIDYMEDLFNAPVNLQKGERSHDKVLWVQRPPEQVHELLRKKVYGNGA